MDYMGYYALVASVRMEWSESTRISVYHFVPVPIHNVMIVIGIIGLLYVLGRNLFMRKEW